MALGQPPNRELAYVRSQPGFLNHGVHQESEDRRRIWGKGYRRKQGSIVAEGWNLEKRVSFEIAPSK